MGLNHSLDGSAVMFPTVSSSTVFNSLHADDIAVMQSIYATASAAVPEPGTIVLLGIGIFWAFWLRLPTKKTIN